MRVKNALKKAVKEWRKRTERNEKRRARRKRMSESERLMMKKRFIRSWNYIALKRKRERLILTTICKRHKELLVKVCFQKLKGRYLRLQKYEIQKGTALFKYSQKLLKLAFQVLHSHSANSKISKMLKEKSQRFYWTKLTTMGLGLFIKNSIRVRSQADLSLRVRI